MSTVRMSDQLQRDITRKAEDMYDRAHPYQEFPEYLGNKIYTKYLKDDLENLSSHVLSNIPNEISNRKLKMAEVTDLSITSNYCIHKNATDDPEDYDGEPEFGEHRFMIKVIGGYQVLKMFNTGSNYNNDELQLDLVINTDNAVPDCELIAELYKIRRENDLRANERNNYRRTVSNTIESFTTLNQALKAWPALKDLVVQDKIDKVYEKVERKAKQQQQREAIEVQEQALNSVILTASLLGD
jgi:hypothetical protein